ncbi:MAG: hypothetical protein KAH86_06065 [Methanosarcinales archaeon]|nr:hypothetical protein [Methanosarcinales archaeon]
MFGRTKSTISEHIKNIFIDGELDETVVIRKFRTTTKHGAIETKTQMSEGDMVIIGRARGVQDMICEAKLHKAKYC